MADTPFASVTVISKVYVVAAMPLGSVPDRSPPDVSVSHASGGLGVEVHVKGSVPPVAANVIEAVGTVVDHAVKGLVVVMLGTALTFSVNDFVSVPPTLSVSVTFTV